jgi:ABC-type nitrate/sulfonate/bicarbonate transport system substrate-binding protein
VLRSKFGLVPDRDVAAAMSIPHLFVARKAGFNELVSFDKLGIVYPYTSVVTLRQTAAKNRDLVEKFLKCIVEGTYLFKTNKSKSLSALRRYERRR